MSVFQQPNRAHHGPGNSVMRGVSVPPNTGGIGITSNDPEAQRHLEIVGGLSAEELSMLMWGFNPVQDTTGPYDGVPKPFRTIQDSGLLGTARNTVIHNFVGLLTEDQLWVFRLMPLHQVSLHDLSVVVKRVTYHGAVLDRVPIFAGSEVLSRSEGANVARSTRVGKQFVQESGFSRTQEGLADYFAMLEQLRIAIVNYFVASALTSLINAPSQGDEAQNQNMQWRLGLGLPPDEESFDAVICHVQACWGASTSPGKWTAMQARVSDILRRRGLRPPTWCIVPSGTTNRMAIQELLKTGSPSLAQLTNPYAANTKGAAQSMMANNDPLDSMVISGARVVEVPLIFDQREPYDICRRPRGYMAYFVGGAPVQMGLPGEFSTVDCVPQLLDHGLDQIVSVPLYPLYRGMPIWAAQLNGATRLSPDFGQRYMAFATWPDYFEHCTRLDPKGRNFLQMYQDRLVGQNGQPAAIVLPNAHNAFVQALGGGPAGPGAFPAWWHQLWNAHPRARALGCLDLVVGAVLQNQAGIDAHLQLPNRGEADYRAFVAALDAAAVDAIHWVDEQRFEALPLGNERRLHCFRLLNFACYAHLRDFVEGAQGNPDQIGAYVRQNAPNDVNDPFNPFGQQQNVVLFAPANPDAFPYTMTLELVNALLAANVPPPIGLIGFRHIVYDMGTAIMVSGNQVGECLYADPDITKWEDGQQKKITGNFTMDVATYLHHPEAVVLVHNAVPLAYAYGGGTSIHMGSDYLQRAQRERHQDKNDIQVLPLYLGEDVTDKYIPLAGRFDPKLKAPAPRGDGETAYSSAWIGQEVFHFDDGYTVLDSALTMEDGLRRPVRSPMAFRDQTFFGRKSTERQPGHMSGFVRRPFTPFGTSLEYPGVVADRLGLGGKGIQLDDIAQYGSMSAMPIGV